MSIRAVRALCALPGVAALLALALAGSPRSAHAVTMLSYHGRWTPTYSSPTYIAVHMALLRDTSSSTYHSKVVWWNDEDSGTVRGGLYGWNPPSSAGEDTCDSFPSDGHFHPLDMSPPGFNMFCGGQVQLWHGDMLVAGGTEYGEVGITDSKFFHPGPLTWSADSGQMALPRWYPTVTALPDGRAMVNGGTQYVHMLIYGGKNSYDNHTAAVLHRLGLQITAGGRWDPPVNTSDSTGGGLGWPDSLEGHTLTPAGDGHPAILFGGRTPDGLASSGMWYRQQAEHTFGSDVGYYWRSMSVTNSSQLALKRADHTAVNVINTGISADTLNAFLVYGGRSGSAAKSDAWRFHSQDFGAANWRWDALKLRPGQGPGAGAGVYGHVAYFDPVHHRMLVFGGASSTDSLPSDSTVYSLDLSSPTDSCLWHTPGVYAPNGRPGPLLGSLFAADSRILTRPDVPTASNLRTGHSAYLFGGKKTQSDSSVTNGLWQLWVSSDVGCDSIEWEPITPDSSAPAARAWGTAVYDVASARVVFLGGTSALGSVEKDVFGLDVGQNAGDAVPSGFHYHWQSMQSIPESGGLSHTAAINGDHFVTARVAEVTSSTGSGPSWSHASPADSTYHAEPWYPFMFVLPDGRLFNAGTGNDGDHRSALFNLSTKHWTPFPLNDAYQSTFYPGSAAMFRPGMVVASGSRDEYYNANSRFGAFAKTEFIDFAHAPQDTAARWGPSINDMMAPRLYHNLVILPTGDVMAVGGDSTDANMDSATVVAKACMRPEMWYPDTVQSGSRGYWHWTTGNGDTLAASHLERDYHGTALLLPDGRVLAGGGNAAPSFAKQLEIYCPPYLFTPSGAQAARPKFHATNLPPDKVGYAQTFHIQTDSLTATSELDSVVLIKPGAVTHGFDEDQRFIRLPTAQCGLDSTIFEVVAPLNANIAPPGDYLMFLVYKNAPASGRYGTPSIARWIRVSSVSGTDGFSCPGGGGCPTVDTRSTSGWATENTILGRSLTGAMATDALVLKNAPIAASGLATVRIRENENEITTLDRVRLATVDHQNGTEVFASGEKISVGKRVPAYHVVTSTGVDITDKVSGAPGALGWLGNVTDTVYVQVDDPAASGHVGRGGRSVGIFGGDKEGPGGGGGASLRPTEGTKANRDLPWLIHTGIVIQVPDASGAWHEVAHQYPREQVGQAILDSLGQDRFRMVFLGKHHLSFVGAIEQAESVAPQMIVPIAAQHTRLGNVLHATLGVDSTQTYLVPGDTLTMSFAIPTMTPGLVRDYVLLTRGVYTSNLTSTPGTTSGPQLPLQFALHQNIPNPFGTTTSIHFDLPTTSRVRVEVFDLLGRRIRTLTDAQWSPGFHQVEWDRRDMQGNLIRNGVFLYRMTAGSFTDHKKMVIVQ